MELSYEDAVWVSRHSGLLFWIFRTARSIDLATGAGLDGYQAATNADEAVFYFPTKYAMDVPYWDDTWAAWQAVRPLPAFAASMEPLMIEFHRVMGEASKSNFGQRDWVSATRRTAMSVADAFDDVLEAALARLGSTAR